MSSKCLPKRLVFNVSGEIYETFEHTLQRFPQTLLGHPDKRQLFYCFHSNEYFLNRNRTCFAYILFFYQSKGILRCPPDTCISVFEEECKFFDIPESMICSMKEKAGIIPELQIITQGHADKTGTFRGRIWNLIENPETSRSARTFTIISMSAIFLSIIAACIETVPAFNHRLHAHENRIEKNGWLIIELLFNLFFLVEFLARFTFSPNKLMFFKELMNWIDAGAILPYFVMLCSTPDQVMSLGFLRTLRLVRILRLFRLNKLYSRRLQIISAIIRSGIDDFKILLVCLFLTVTLIGSAMFYIEKSQTSEFTDIPISKWWAVVTLTTSGYGDVIPCTVIGRFVAACYMLFGAMTITLPVLSIGSKLKTVYDKNVRLDETID